MSPVTTVRSQEILHGDINAVAALGDIMLQQLLPEALLSVPTYLITSQYYYVRWVFEEAVYHKEELQYAMFTIRKLQYNHSHKALALCDTGQSREISITTPSTHYPPETRSCANGFHSLSSIQTQSWAHPRTEFATHNA